MHIWPSDSIVELWSFKLFIILKKNNSHLSFLHCYHHFFMAFGMYMATLWIPGGHGCMLGMVNTFVHAFMYFYFFLTAFKPELKRSIWWKKHITQFQMVRTFNLWVSNLQFLPFSASLLSCLCISFEELWPKIAGTQSFGCGRWWFRIRSCSLYLPIFIIKHIWRRNKSKFSHKFDFVIILTFEGFTIIFGNIKYLPLILPHHCPFCTWFQCEFDCACNETQ